MAEEDRMTGAKKLFIGIVYIPLMLLMFVSLVILMAIAWKINVLSIILREEAVFKGDSRLGYLMYWSQRNIQFLTTGRGEFEWTP